MADLQTTRRDERDFLLRSLDDLDAEFEAGDIDETDYHTLHSDYTIRAANAIRALERATPLPPAPRRSWKRITLWTLLIVVVSGLAGVWVAEFSGSRGMGTITGSVRLSVRQQLFDASQLLGTEPAQALEMYDAVLAEEPSNVEALAYRGWLTNLEGDPATARGYLEDAVLADPTYPDARVFAAVVALNSGDVDAAAAHVAALDALEVPPFIEQLVQGQGLRVGLVEARLLTGVPNAFAASGLTVEEVARAADNLLSSQEITRALALYNVLLSEARDNLDVATEAGWFLGRLAFNGPAELNESMTTADELLTEALAIDPGHPPALVYRAFVRLWLGDLEAGRADLATYDALDADREDLDFLISETGLRDLLDGGSVEPE
jgi:tetratricopeptide (TPR) repeat protein